MRRIAQLSDFHFGRHDPAVVDALPEDVARFAPDLTIVSGDLTQRAHLRQFIAARAFVARLPAPRIVIPGNHDLSILDLLARVLRPRSRFVAQFGGHADPSFVDGELAVLALDTARWHAWKNGRISRAQRERAASFFAAHGNGRLRVLVTHHPFVPRPGERRARMTPRAQRIRHELLAHRVDLLLAGHYHQAYTARYRLAAGHPGVLVIQGGTAVSDRVRREPNSYNRLVVDGDRLALTVRRWNGRQFADESTVRFRRAPDSWLEEDTP